MEPVEAILIVIWLLCFACCVWSAVRVFKDRKELASCPTIKGWVARDKAGGLFAYTKEPDRGECVWLSKDDVYISIPCDRFPNLRWEDEPIEVEFIIKKEDAK